MTNKQYIKEIRNINLFFLTSGVIFTVAQVVLKEAGYEKIIEADEETMFYLIPLLISIMTLFAYFMYFTMIKSASGIPGLEKKLKKYREIYMLHLIIIQFSILIPAIFYLSTGKWYYLLLSGAILVFQYMNRPSITKVCRELKLAGPDENILCNNDEITIADD